MPDAVQLIIPDAGHPSPECAKIIEGLRLPWLTRLLALLTAQPLQTFDSDESLSTPFEHALAAAQGLPGSDGRYPWAAWQAQRAGIATGTDAWGLITPCHWMVGSDHVAMDVPAALALQRDESQSLLQAMRPFFEEDGIRLQMLNPGQWLARGEVFRTLATASPERVRGEPVHEWLPTEPTLRRLQNEMQMLLYTHPVNDARAERRLQPVNSFWVSGCGALPADAAPAPSPEPVVADELKASAVREDWATWGKTWERIDAADCASLHAQAAAGQPVRLTLCGLRASQTFVTHKRSTLQTLAARLRPLRIATILNAL